MQTSVLVMMVEKGKLIFKESEKDFEKRRFFQSLILIPLVLLLLGLVFYFFYHRIFLPGILLFPLILLSYTIYSIYKKICPLEFYQNGFMDRLNHNKFHLYKDVKKIKYGYDKKTITFHIWFQDGRDIVFFNSILLKYGKKMYTVFRKKVVKEKMVWFD